MACNDQTQAPEQESRSPSAPAPRRRRGWRIAAVLLFVLAVLAAVAFRFYQKWRADAWEPPQVILETVKSITESSELMQQARELKASLRSLAAALQAQDLDAAEESRAAMRRSCAEIRTILEEPIWKTAAVMPGVRNEIQAVGELLSLLEESDDELIGPCMEQLARDPIDSLKTDEGVSFDALLRYLDLFEELMPKAQTLCTRLKAVDLGALDRDGDFEKTIGSLETALSAAETMQERLPELRELLVACRDQLARDPIESLSAEGGLRVDALLRYLDLFEEVLPKARSVYEGLRAVDLGGLDTEGRLDALLGEVEDTLRLGEELKEMLPALRVLLGGGSDRLYIFAAQNSAEIRASGGFPGSVGVIRIRDGLLTVSDFRSVYDVFFSAVSAEAQITQVEQRIFGGRMNLSWDSDFSPDFERVASIWAMAYERRNNEAVDGVISATPAVIPRLLSILGSITLSEGTELNGENAGRVLGHDLYFKYLGRQHGLEAYNYVDSLFSECARKTLDLLLSELDLAKLPAYYAFFRDSFADRTLMAWMADEEEEALMKEMGWAATLNDDPQRPEIGIFFNSTIASKMGWFLEIETSLSEPVEEEDGSLSYELTVTLSSTITQEERALASSYILGGTQGITGFFYVFAPAGGRLLSMTAENWIVERAVYEELELGYLPRVTMFDNRPVTVTCRIAAAPGVETRPVLVVTPTMQEFH